jgi:hypothetical protein
MLNGKQSATYHLAITRAKRHIKRVERPIKQGKRVIKRKRRTTV